MSEHTTAFGTDPFGPDTDDERGFAAGLHPVNTGHLVMGVAFLGLAALAALYISGLVGDNARWFLSVPWLMAGAAGMAATFLASRRGSRPTR